LRRTEIESGHKEGLKAAAEFCELEGLEIDEMNFSSRVVI